MCNFVVSLSSKDEFCKTCLNLILNIVEIKFPLGIFLLNKGYVPKLLTPLQNGMYKFVVFLSSKDVFRKTCLNLIFDIVEIKFLLGLLLLNKWSKISASSFLQNVFNTHY